MRQPPTHHDVSAYLRGIANDIRGGVCWSLKKTFAPVRWLFGFDLQDGPAECGDQAGISEAIRLQQIVILEVAALVVYVNGYKARNRRKPEKMRRKGT